MPRAHVLPDGPKIAALRGEADLTQWELAKEAGYGLRTIGKIESGKPTGASTLSAAAVVLSRRLKRPVELSDLIQRCCSNSYGTPAGAAASVVEEGLKYLDLSGGRAPKGVSNGCTRDSRAVLIDHYRYRSLPARPTTLTFHYATTGEHIEGHALSHPASARWLELLEQGGGTHLRHCYQMQVGVDDAGPRAVRNRLEYVNAFTGRDGDWFHTHVVQPTDCLTMIVLFPTAKPCRALKGVVQQHPAGPFLPTADEPFLAPDGKLAHWRVPAPQVGGTYQLDWQW